MKPEGKATAEPELSVSGTEGPPWNSDPTEEEGPW